MTVNDDEIMAILKMKHMLKDAGTPVPQFLRWVADRLVKVHGDNELVDFVHALKDRAKQIEEIAYLLGVTRG